MVIDSLGTRLLNGNSEAIREVAFDRGIGFQPVVFLADSQAGSLRHGPFRTAIQMANRLKLAETTAILTLHRIGDTGRGLALLLNVGRVSFAAARAKRFIDRRGTGLFFILLRRF